MSNKIGETPKIGRPTTVGADVMVAGRVPSELRDRCHGLMREGESFSAFQRDALERECRRRERLAD